MPRPPMDGARSALVRNASDQLKPSPICRHGELVGTFFGLLGSFVLDVLDVVDAEDRPRPLEGVEGGELAK